MSQTANNSGFYTEIRTLIEQSRTRTYQAVNFAMVQTYWQIGKRIVEEEQAGNTRAGYGEYLIEMLAENLTVDFNQGFDKRNLFYMRRFYIAFPIVNALRSQLSWTHFLVKNENILQEKLMHYGNQ